MTEAIDKKIDLSDKLEVVLITYNRGKKLARTLNALSESPVSGLCLTIYDNASMDDTGEVCRSFCARHSLWKHVRRDFNIGAPPNYVDAVAHAKKPYVWVICDDDQYDFSAWKELVEAIDQGNDAIFVGSPAMRKEDLGYRGGIDDWMSKGGAYYLVGAFIPCLIFRQAALPPVWKRRLYAAGGCLWPQLAVLDALATQATSMRILNTQLVIREEGDDYSASVLPHGTLLLHWLRITREIDNKWRRKEAVKQFFEFFHYPKKSAYRTDPFRCAGGVALDLALGAMSNSDLMEIRERLPGGFVKFKIALGLAAWTPVWILKSLLIPISKRTRSRGATRVDHSSQSRW